MNDKKQIKEYRGSKAGLAIILVTSLFFVWGLTMNLVNALYAPMGNYMRLSNTETSLLQVAYFGAYFFLSIPASIISRKFGYKGGIMTGLVLFIIGSLLTIPATNSMSYTLFLLAMFVIACGSATLETNCNPYITKLGDPENESMRINLAQSFNGVGNIVGPVILGNIIGQTINYGEPGFEEAKLEFLSNTKGIYIVIAIALIAVIAVFFFANLPSPPGDDEEKVRDEKTGEIISRLMSRTHFVLGIIAEFIFIGLQVGGMALFSSYAVSSWEGMTSGTATKYLAVLSLLFTIGRFVTTPLMKKFEAGKILGVYMTTSAICMVTVGLGLGKLSVILFMGAYLFISIGFPTIFSLALTDIKGNDAKTGSSMLVMSIVGAAIIPLIMSAVGDKLGIQAAMWLTVPGFLYCAWYGFKGLKKNLEVQNEKN